MKKVFDFSNYVEFLRRSPFDFSKNSSIGCGGFAPVAFYPQSVPELTSLVDRLTEEGIPYCVLGNLTNVLPSDEGMQGAVISTKKLLGITAGERLFAYAGETSGTLLRACKSAGLSGAEFLSGVPCTLGGAAYMNAGAAGKYLSEIVESVLVLRAGKRITLSLEECDYAYKKSVFMKNDDVILGVTLRLQSSTVAEIEKREGSYIERRKHLPKGRSMGCVFKNPEGYAAGELIERSGLKGLRVGGAKVSKEHANFIINEGGTARDIKTLIKLVKNAVLAQYGVALQEEIRYLGENSDTDG